MSKPHRPPPSRRSFNAALTGLVLVGAGTLAFVLIDPLAPPPDPFAQCRTSTMAGAAEIGGPFTLTASTGARVTEADVIDGLTLIYFGYSFCPDVCPLDLTRNALVTESLDDANISIRPVFITVDPARDTPEQMADYTAHLHPRMLGLTGSEDEIASIARAYRVYFARQGDDPDDPYYTVDHTVQSYLMHPDHGLLQFFGREARVDEMSRVIACYASVLGS